MPVAGLEVRAELGSVDAIWGCGAKGAFYPRKYPNPLPDRATRRTQGRPLELAAALMSLVEFARGRVQHRVCRDCVALPDR